MAYYIYTESYVSVPVPNYAQALKPLADNCHFDHKLLNFYLVYNFAGWDFEIFCGRVVQRPEIKTGKYHSPTQKKKMILAKLT